MSVQPYYQQPALAPQNGYLPAPVAPPQPSQVQRLAEWAQAAQAAYSVAEDLVRTSFVPEQFKGKAHEATAAILAGSEVGLSPMASLRSFSIIQGTAAPNAITQRAVLQSVGHSVWLVDADDSRAIVRGQRKGSEQVQESTWTIERARSMGLTGKKNWKEQPKAMLIARATAECCRLVAADALLGMPYSSEELGDGGAPLQATAEVMPTEEPKRTARRKTPPARQAPANTRPAPAETVQDGPPLPGEEDEPTDTPRANAIDELNEPRTYDDDGNKLITKAQLTKLAIELKEAGLTDRSRGLAFMSVLTGREIRTSKELTVEEASNVIDHLDRLAPDEVAAIIDDSDGDDQ
jgi:hypothetical protein